jgi:hypothetical protein
VDPSAVALRFITISRCALKSAGQLFVFCSMASELMAGFYAERIACKALMHRNILAFQRGASVDRELREVRVLRMLGGAVARHGQIFVVVSNELGNR